MYQYHLTVGLSNERDAVRELFCRLWRSWHPGNETEAERVLGVNQGEAQHRSRVRLTIFDSHL